SSAMAGPVVSRAEYVFLLYLPNPFLHQGIPRVDPSTVPPRPRNRARPAYHPPAERDENASRFGSGRPRGGSSRRLRGRRPAPRGFAARPARGPRGRARRDVPPRHAGGTVADVDP